MFATTEKLVPNVIRQHHHRVRPYAAIVGLDGIVQSISFFTLENASNSAAWFLAEKVKDDELYYMGPNDIRYLIWVIAAMKTGKCVYFPSLSNQIQANQRFFETVGAKILLYAPEASDVLEPLRSATREIVEHIASPTYDELMLEDVSTPYPFEKSFDDVKNTNVMGLHTSGTSGHPKPIRWNHSALSTIPSFLDPTIKDGNGNDLNLMRELFLGQDILVPFPLYHFGGMGSSLCSLFCDSTIVIPAIGVRLTPENYTTLLEMGHCTATAAPPSILESMLNYPSGMDSLAKLKHIAYTGGPLNPTRGQALASRLPHLFTILASTEGGIGRFISTGDSSCWDSFKFVDVGQRMEEVAPGIYELVFPRTELVNRVYAYFHTHPHLDLEFRTSDLFAPVEGSDSWKYKGRADNWIAMSNGLKMDPTEMEHTIASHPDVTGVLIAGSYRFRLCVLIEVKEGVELSLDTIWPTIEAANKKVPKFGRVPKELVLFASPDRPFLRAGKGTVQRRLTVQAYEQDIDRLYSEVEEGLFTSGVALPQSLKSQDLVPFLQNLCSQTLFDYDDVADSGNTINVDDDLFTLGLDSLSTFVLLARLKAALKKCDVKADVIGLIDNKLIYATATIRQLADKLSQVLSSDEPTNNPVLNEDDDGMMALLEKYNKKLEELAPVNTLRRTERPEGQVVVLTGSTGSLGSYILASLLTRGDVRKVFCLNRNGDAKAQSASFKTRGLPASLVDDGDRAVFFQVKPMEEKLGLSKEAYALIAQEATCIVHNAFPVNFLLNLRSFEPQLQYLINLFRLSTHSNHGATVLFISSISAAIPAAVHEHIIPEEVLTREQAKHLLHQGYAQSKYICERLMANYTFTLGRPAAVLRVGQVCGPLAGTGVWNISEWFPSLVLSSRFLGAVPDSISNPEIDWVPVDRLGDIIAELVSVAASEHGNPASSRVYNVVNPAKATWDTLLPALQAMGPLPIISAAEWVERLEKSDNGPQVICENPAAKLVDFYKQTMLGGGTAPKVEIRNLLRASEVGANLPPIGQEQLLRWMQGWGLR